MRGLKASEEGLDAGSSIAVLQQPCAQLYLCQRAMKAATQVPKFAEGLRAMRRRNAHGDRRELVPRVR